MRFLFLLIGCAFAFQAASQVVVQRSSSENASGKNRIRIPLHADIVKMFGGETPLVKRILWCRALSPSNQARYVDPMNLLRNNVIEQPFEDVGCATPGMIHFQIYPGAVLAHQSDEEPNVIYIDSNGFGSLWDEKLPMEIVVELRVNENTLAQHVAKFEWKEPKTVKPGKTHPWKSVLGLLVGGAVFFVCMGVLMYRNKMDKIKRKADDEPLVDSDEAILERMNE